jgi:hypothetical protein
MLGEETLKAVPCAHPRCTISYAEHTSDRVCFLKLKRDTTNKELSEALKALVDILGEKYLDGFSFIETEEKFRIN